MPIDLDAIRARHLVGYPDGDENDSLDAATDDVGALLAEVERLSGELAKVEGAVGALIDGLRDVGNERSALVAELDRLTDEVRFQSALRGDLIAGHTEISARRARELVRLQEEVERLRAQLDAERGLRPQKEGRDDK